MIDPALSLRASGTNHILCAARHMILRDYQTEYYHGRQICLVPASSNIVESRYESKWSRSIKPLPRHRRHWYGTWYVTGFTLPEYHGDFLCSIIPRMDLAYAVQFDVELPIVHAVFTNSILLQ
jgi:hypothetical protein